MSVLHDIGVTLWPVWFVAPLAGATMPGGVGLARRSGAATTKIATGSVVVAFVAVIAFIAGGIIFGY